MNIDTLRITILKDGTIKTVSDAVSAANHDNAEQFLTAMANLSGGETTREARTDVDHVHDHEHGHTHSHGEHTHQH
ncbi:MAG: hypothetical protein ACRDQZ_11835 [Mycobacteriales bacterium]